MVHSSVLRWKQHLRYTHDCAKFHCSSLLYALIVKRKLRYQTKGIKDRTQPAGLNWKQGGGGNRFPPSNKSGLFGPNAKPFTILVTKHRGNTGYIYDITRSCGLTQKKSFRNLNLTPVIFFHKKYLLCIRIARLMANQEPRLKFEGEKMRQFFIKFYSNVLCLGSNCWANSLMPIQCLKPHHLMQRIHVTFFYPFYLNQYTVFNIVCHRFYSQV